MAKVTSVAADAQLMLLVWFSGGSGCHLTQEVFSDKLSTEPAPETHLGPVKVPVNDPSHSGDEQTSLSLVNFPQIKKQKRKVEHGRVSRGLRS